MRRLLTKGRDAAADIGVASWVTLRRQVLEPALPDLVVPYPSFCAHITHLGQYEHFVPLYRLTSMSLIAHQSELVPPALLGGLKGPLSRPKLQLGRSLGCENLQQTRRPPMDISQGGVNTLTASRNKSILFLCACLGSLGWQQQEQKQNASQKHQAQPFSDPLPYSLVHSKPAKLPPSQMSRFFFSATPVTFRRV